jgi:hypothetical protein
MSTTFEGKVFGIGLGKTGTTSLTKALGMLGIETVQFPTDRTTFEELSSGRYRLSIMQRYQGMTDTPAAFFVQLDEAYPGAKFILSTRDKRSWLRSIETYWRLRGSPGRDTSERGPSTRFIAAATFGSHEFNESRFSYVFDLHHRLVLEHFADRPDDLLVIDVCAGEGWERLCPFLGQPVPDLAFPFLNTENDARAEAAWWVDWGKAVEDVAEVIPPGTPFVLVDGDELGHDFLADRRRVPFPERDGAYWGPPDDDAAAIAELERVRGEGTRYVVFAWPAFWWLEQYEGFAAHLQSRYQRVVDGERVVIFDMGRS